MFLQSDITALSTLFPEGGDTAIKIKYTSLDCLPPLISARSAA